MTNQVKTKQQLKRINKYLSNIIVLFRKGYTTQTVFQHINHYRFNEK